MNDRRLRFWEFSLSVHEEAGVEKECLDLQDRGGINVNLLLFCAYVGAVHGALLPKTELAQAIRLVEPWHNDVVNGLRASRRALKPFATGTSPIAAPAATLRGSVKAAELAAERLEQMLLEDWSVSRFAAWSRISPAEAIATNIRALFAVGDGKATEADCPHQLVAAALAAARRAHAILPE